MWAQRPDGTRLHVGGEFTQVNDVNQTYYTRLSFFLAATNGTS